LGTLTPLPQEETITPRTRVWRRGRTVDEGAGGDVSAGIVLADGEVPREVGDRGEDHLAGLQEERPGVLTLPGARGHPSPPPPRIPADQPEGAAGPVECDGNTRVLVPSHHTPSGGDQGRGRGLARLLALETGRQESSLQKLTSGVQRSHAPPPTPLPSFVVKPRDTHEGGDDKPRPVRSHVRPIAARPGTRGVPVAAAPP